MGFPPRVISTGSIDLLVKRVCPQAGIAGTKEVGSVVLNAPRMHAVTHTTARSGQGRPASERQNLRERESFSCICIKRAASPCVRTPARSGQTRPIGTGFIAG